MKNQVLEKEILSMDAFISLMKASDHVSSFVHAHLKEEGITVSQFGVLEALNYKGSMCQKDIAEIIRKTTGNMTTVIDNLEKHGLAVRKKDAADRRYFTVSITDKGRQVLNDAFEVYKKNVSERLSALTIVELETLIGICRKLEKE